MLSTDGNVARSQRRALSIPVFVAVLSGCPIPDPGDMPGSTGASTNEALDITAGGESGESGGATTEPTTQGPTGGCDSDICCSPGAAQQCHDGAVHSFDSCGNDAGLLEACVGDLICVNTSATTAECEPLKSCGNGMLDADEQCDGRNLGGATCASQGFEPGTLTCSPGCQFDTAGCCSSQASYQCLGDSVQWLDSCGGPGDIKEECPRGLSCTNTSATTAECTGGQPCGNGSIDGDEACDGVNLGGATCNSLGFDSGFLGCTDACSFDTGGCASQSCKIVASPSVGSWTPSFEPQVNCSCSEDDPDCHTLYQGRVDTIVGNTATMSFHKTGGGGPSVQVSYWLVVGAEEFPACHDLFAYVDRKTGKWAAKLDPLQVDVPVWPSDDEFAAAPEGATKRLFMITGGSDNPVVRTWYQKQSILFTKVCE